jgi:hypothetical protein
MEKQLAFFQVEGNDDFTIWPDLPEQNRQKIESIFAKLLIRYLSSSLEEVKKHEK